MKSAGKKIKGHFVTTNVTFYVNRLGEIFRRAFLATVSRLEYISSFFRYDELSGKCVTGDILHSFRFSR